MSKEEMGRGVWEHHASMMRLAVSIVHNCQDAEDAVSEAAVRAMSSADGLRDESRLRQWLLSITAHCCYDCLRKKKREQPTGNVGLFDLPVFEAEPDNPVFQKLQTLPASLSQVLTLYYYEGYLAREIAKILRIPLSTVLMRMSRGRRKLKALYEAEGRDAQ